VVFAAFLIYVAYFVDFVDAYMDRGNFVWMVSMVLCFASAAAILQEKERKLTAKRQREAIAQTQRQSEAQRLHEAFRSMSQVPQPAPAAAALRNLDMGLRNRHVYSTEELEDRGLCVHRSNLDDENSGCLTFRIDGNGKPDTLVSPTGKRVVKTPDRRLQ